MKTISTLLGFFFSIACATGHPVYNKLQTVNQYWSAQKDVTLADLPAQGAGSAQEWIQLHLSLVETTLRKRNTDRLSAAQQKNRARCLDYLHTYWQEARFPRNEDYDYRTPIFIDRHDNFCAVGYLVKASGYEHVSRKIAAQTNLAYVHEMSYPELTAWAEEHGFTKDELAWIQPGYPPEIVAMSIGKGTNGSVYALYPDETGEMLFAGGAFSKADSTITVNNIAYITETEGSFTWHAMGSGVNGKVYAITQYDNHIFAGGSFTEAGGTSANNVAYWDGQSWHAAGCLSGVVKDLVVFNGALFASGRFDVCTSDTNINFARWNGAQWEPIPGVSGVINTMEALDTMLLLGGTFTYNDDSVNVIRWQASNGFTPYNNAIKNEVNDFTLFKDVLYAVCKYTPGAADTFLFQKLAGTTWEPADTSLYFKGDHLSMNCLYIRNQTHDWQFLVAGGHFQFSKYNWALPPPSINLAYMNPEGIDYTTWAHVDSGVYAITTFKNNTIFGGDFRNNYYNEPLGGIARIPGRAAGVNDPAQTHTRMHLYPNPVSPHGVLQIHNGVGTDITSFTLRDIGGKEIFRREKRQGNTGTQITLPGVTPGLYMAEIHDSEGTRSISKLLIE